jgi:hypothetical protein
MCTMIIAIDSITALQQMAVVRTAGLQEQLRRVEKDRQDLLEICQGRLAGIPGA